MTEIDTLKVQLIETQLQLLQANAIILQGQRGDIIARAEKETPMPEDFDALLACRLSGQIDDARWEQHKADPAFRAWLDTKVAKG